MASRHLEIEQKYAVPDDFVLPSVTADGIVDHVDDDFTLDASYFDTHGLALLRRGVTLRRRTGGHDEGWHLKLPTSGSGRAAKGEISVPLDRAPAEVIPAELTSIVTPLVRDRDLVTVAHLRTRRRTRRLIDATGAVAAELALDDVVGEDVLEGRTTRWTEFEAELVDGEPSILDRVDREVRAKGAHAAGYPSKVGHALRGSDDGGSDRAAGGTFARDIVAHYLDLQLTALLEADLHLRSGTDQTDAIHDMRVAARRLRACLTTYRTLLASGASKPLRADLKWIGDILGRARDADVLRSTLLARVDAEPAEHVLGPVRARLDAITFAAAAHARSELSDALGDSRYLGLLAELERLTVELPQRSTKKGMKTLRQRTRHEKARLRRRHATWQQASPSDADAALHDVRKATKRLRYADEVIAANSGRSHGVKRQIKRLKSIQDVLGTQHDAVVAKVALRTMAVNAYAAGENAFTFGRLHARADDDARNATRKFERRWTHAGR